MPHSLLTSIKLLLLCTGIYHLVTTMEAAAAVQEKVEASTQNNIINSTTTQSPVGRNNSTGSSIGASNQSADVLSVLESPDGSSKVSALVRRHGDIRLDANDKGTVVQNGAMKNIHTRVMSSESFDELACSAKIKGPLVRLYGNSKYFADSDHTYNHAKAKDLCQDHGLDLAELEDIADHRSVQQYVSQFRVVEGCSKKFFIGVNDIETEGIFTQSSGKDLTFQNFHLSQPNDRNQDEDCVALMKEMAGGPVGSADVDCDKPANVLCMFPIGTECYKESSETVENVKLVESRGLVSITNITDARNYFVGNFQLTWNKAMRYCIKRNMSLFNMDGDVTMEFFETLLKWETDFVRVPSPPLQYWTSGRFQGSHMTAPIMWANYPMDTSSSEEGDFSGEERSAHTLLRNTTFTWSGVYRWSSQKGKDPGGAYGYRRDLCVSFGFEDKPEVIPVLRNTNCDLPAYFICSQKVPKVEKGDY